MMCNYMINYSIMNNNYFQTPTPIYQNLIYNPYNNQYLINQRNNSCHIRQNKFLQNYQNSFFNQNKNCNSVNHNAKFNIQNRKTITKRNILLKKDIKKENIFEKKNTIKINHPRKSSVDTTISDNSFNSSIIDDEHDKNKEEISNNKNIINISKFLYINNLKRRLSNISEKNSELSNNSEDDSNSSFFSISDEEEEKKTNNNKIDCKNKQYNGNPEFENTEILRVNVKISKDKIAVFKLKRFDDIFLTIKLFCEIYSIDEQLIKPFIIKSLSTLNTIYQVMNSKLEKEQINLLNKIRSIKILDIY